MLSPALASQANKPLRARPCKSMAQSNRCRRMARIPLKSLGQARNDDPCLRGKEKMPARAGSCSSKGMRLDSSHQNISLRGRWSLSRRSTGSACTTSPSELGLRMRIFNQAPGGRAGRNADPAGRRKSRSVYRPKARRSANRSGNPASRIFFWAAAMSYSSRRNSMVASSRS